MKKRTYWIVPMLLAFACLSRAIAQNDVVEMAPLVVTASRIPEPINETAASVAQVTDTALYERQGRTLPESLATIPGVHVQKTSYGQGSPYIRGFTGFHTLLLVDGIRLNSPIFRSGPNQYWNTVDSFSLSRLELLKGPGAVLYGSDAVGGTLQAFTSLPEFAPEGEAVWGGRLAGRAASAERSIIGRAETSYATDQYAAQIGVTAKSFGDLDGGRHVRKQKKTDYDELNFDAKLRLALPGDREMILAFMSVDQDDIWRTHRTPWGISWRGTTIGTEPIHRFDQDHDLAYARYIDRESTALYDQMELTFYGQRQKETKEVQKSSGTSEVDGFDVRTLGVKADFLKDSDVGVWAYGAEYIHDKIDSFHRSYGADGNFLSYGIQGSVADDSYYHTAAVYLQDRIALTDRIELTAGARLTYAKADIGRYENFETDPHTPASFKDDWTDFSGHLRLAGQLIENHWLVYASLSQAYRAPGLYDLTSFNVNRSTDIAIPSPNLDPEKFIVGEIGSRLENQYASWHIAYFYTDLRDQIISHHIGDNYFSRANSGKGYVHGVETELVLNYTEQWQSRFGFTWMEGYTDYTDTSGEAIHEYIRTMPMSGFATLHWQAPSRRFWAEAMVHAVDKEDRLTANDKRDTQRIPPEGTPGYVVANLRGGWKVCDRFSVVAGLENLTNKSYRNHGSGSNEAGRNFILSAEYTF